MKGASLPGHTPLRWFLCGFAAATLAAALLQAAPAAAQSVSARDRDQARSGAPGEPGEAGRSSRNAGSGPDVDAENPAPDIPDVIPSDDPSQDPPETEDDGEPRPRAGQRAVIKDGDLTLPVEAPLARDGVIDVGEPLPPEDGTDPTAIDTRPTEEIAIFENPPAGFDPLLFQIEDIDPILTDRRPGRLFRIEPYDPIGIRLGSFVFFPDAEIAGVATSNVLRSPDDRSDVAVEIKESSRLVSNWTTHALEFRSTGLLSFHDEFPSEDDRSWGVEGRGRLDVAKRTNLQALLSHNFQREGRSAIDASAAGERSEVATDVAALTLNHRFNRLAIQLRGSATDADYTDPAAVAGTATDEERDVVQGREAVRATWEFKPTFAVFSEVETNQRNFGAAAVSDTIKRDSNGERYRTGVDFGGTGEILRGEVSLGYGIQRPDDGRLEDVEGFLIDSNVAWKFNDLTTFQFLARSEIFDTTTAKSAGVVSHQIGIEARHAFRRYLVGTAGLTFQTQDFDNTAIEEQEWRTTLGLEYFVSREFILFGRYQHIAFDSNQAASDYHVDEARVGLRIRR